MIWPPTLCENSLEDDDIDRLLKPNLQVGDIVRRVSVVRFYQPLINTIIRDNQI